MELEINKITERIITAAIAVHKELGPGLLESPYEICLVHELVSNKLTVERQKGLPIHYRGINLDCGIELTFLLKERWSLS